MNFGLQSSYMLIQSLFWKLWKCSILTNTNQTWEPWAKNLKAYNVFNHSLEFINTLKQKDSLVDAAARGRLIVL